MNKRKYSKVLSSQTREGITGRYTHWELILECGHTATENKWKQGMRTQTNPCPTRVVCQKCLTPNPAQS